MDLERLRPYLNATIADISFPQFKNHYQGKIRENYDLADGRRIIVATDRLSAFDIILTSIPLKGQALTQIARYWFDQTADICPNHVLEYPDPNVVVAKRLDMLPIEIVVRDYLTGNTGTSILTMYKKGQREMYGVQFPDGMRDNQKLPHPIITPTTKAGIGDHDEPLSLKRIVELGLLGQKLLDQVSEYALALFARGQEIAKKRGLILVDTKYEFGVDRDGVLTIADEIHTPDSSRYWLESSYPASFEKGASPESFDKDVVRKWVAAQCDPYKDPIPAIPAEFILKTSQVYVEAFEKITATPFALPPAGEDPKTRIGRNISRYAGA